MRNKIQYLTKEHIIGEDAVKEFLYGCIHTLNLGMGFHPDDNFEDYIKGHKKAKATFTRKESRELNKSLNEAHEQCQILGLDIYAIGLKILEPVLNKAFGV